MPSVFRHYRHGVKIILTIIGFHLQWFSDIPNQYYSTAATMTCFSILHICSLYIQSDSQHVFRKQLRLQSSSKEYMESSAEQNLMNFFISPVSMSITVKTAHATISTSFFLASRICTFFPFIINLARLLYLSIYPKVVQNTLHTMIVGKRNLFWLIVINVVDTTISDKIYRKGGPLFYQRGQIL